MNGANRSTRHLFCLFQVQFQVEVVFVASLLRMNAVFMQACGHYAHVVSRQAGDEEKTCAGDQNVCQAMSQKVLCF